MTDAGSLRGRLLLWLALLLLLVLLASGLSAYWNGREVADTAYDRTLLASARAIADGLYEKDGTLRADVPYVALDTFAYDSAGRIFYQVNDIHGRMISGYENLPAAPADTLRTDDYPALAKFYDGVYQGVDVRVVSLLQPVSEPSMSGMAEIRVAETEGARERMARSLMTDTLLRLGVLGVGALVLVWLAVSAALRPLDRLRREVEERQPDDLRPLPMLEVQHELRPLVESLNHFTQRLRSLFERQSQFIADAAHELRTPLAALKARLELGLREQEPEAWRSTLETTAKNTDRLIHLANQLLSLARIESGAQAIAEGGAERIDLTALARELGLALAPLAYARGASLALESAGPVWIQGEPTLLNELLSNLLDNALAHTPQGGNVILRVLEGGVLEVEDDGPGIPAADRERVFQRFYRRGDSPGSGLGLAIVGEVCRAHRAQIQLDQGELGGLLVRASRWSRAGLLQHAGGGFQGAGEVLVFLHVDGRLEAELGERRDLAPVQAGIGMLAAKVALQGGDLDQVGIVRARRVAGEVQVLARDLGDRRGEIPGLENALADQRMDALDHMAQADGVRQQLVVILGVGEDRQHADLVHQSGQGRLVRRQAGVVTGQHVADAGDLGALVPDFAHLAIDHVGGGLEHLLHGQAGGQVAGVVDAQPADRHLQVGDFLRAAQQRTVHHADDARGQRRVVADHLAQGLDADIRVFRRLTDLQGHLGQGRQHQFILIDGADQVLLDFVGKLAHGISFENAMAGARSTCTGHGNTGGPSADGEAQFTVSAGFRGRCPACKAD